jgi:hypothetical protein
MTATLSTHDTNPSRATAFQELGEADLMTVDGGIFPIIIGGIVITKGAALVVGGAITLFGAGVGVGYLVNKK